jgi:hypothetical protein
MKLKILGTLFLSVVVFSCLPDGIHPNSQKEEVELLDERLIVLLKKPEQGFIHNIKISLHSNWPDSISIYHSGDLAQTAYVLKSKNKFSYSGDWYSDSCFVKIHKQPSSNKLLKIKYSFND